MYAHLSVLSGARRAEEGLWRAGWVAALVFCSSPGIGRALFKMVDTRTTAACALVDRDGSPPASCSPQRPQRRTSGRRGPVAGWVVGGAGTLQKAPMTNR
eukprot:CAMPEP_0119469226 /NCGR_PEP_ID=MMETSP1344-20130328/2648_1 /TAXON_ID=236787 /ORGANISM="Florenciella parvula, Strain CCMP2471" /LENGTH=99 /DNA_ID=CAMNT_0007501773 /DNA_START=352 /DNA_END=647 /DNA_ORIENTATION=-